MKTMKRALLTLAVVAFLAPPQPSFATLSNVQSYPIDSGFAVDSRKSGFLSSDGSSFNVLGTDWSTGETKLFQLDLTSRTFTSARVGDYGGNAALSSDGSELWMSGLWRDINNNPYYAAGVYDTSDYSTPVATFSMSHSPSGIAITPDMSRVFALDPRNFSTQGGPRLTVIDNTTTPKSRLHDIGNPALPWFEEIIATDTHVYLHSMDTTVPTGVVSKIPISSLNSGSTAGRVDFTVGTYNTFSMVPNVRLTPDESEVWVTGLGANSVIVYDTSLTSNSSTPTATITFDGLNDPRKIAFDATNGVAVIADAGGAVHTVDIATKALVDTFDLKAALSVARVTPAGLAVTPDSSHIIVVDGESESIHVMDANFGASSDSSTPQNQPESSESLRKERAALHLDLTSSPGEPYARASLLIEAEGLPARQPVTLTLGPSGGALISDVASRDGNFSTRVALPPGLEPGNYELTWESRNSAGEVLAIVHRFAILMDGTVGPSTVPETSVTPGADDSHTPRARGADEGTIREDSSSQTTPEVRTEPSDLQSQESGPSSGATTTTPGLIPQWAILTLSAILVAGLAATGVILWRRVMTSS